jgi:hypothetical protein
MMSVRSTLFTLVAFLGLSAPAFADDARGLLVIYKRSSTTGQMQSAQSKAGVTKRRLLLGDAPRTYLIPTTHDSLAVARRLRRNPAVLAADPNWVIHGATDNQYELYQQAFFTQLGLDRSFTAMPFVDSTASPIRLALVDSGVDWNAPDLVNVPHLCGRSEMEGVVAGAIDNLELVGGGPHTAEYYDVPDCQLSDDSYAVHGTAVASVAAGTSAGGVGLRGTAIPTATELLSCQAEADGANLNENPTGTIADEIDCIYWAADRGANVINISIQDSHDAAALEQAVQYAWDNGNGALVVSGSGDAFGDGAIGPEGESYPAAYPETLSVGGTNHQGTGPAVSSTRSSTVDIAAPADDIRVAVPDLSIPYRTTGGTSLSSPEVAGAAAAVMAAVPGLHRNPALVRQWLISHASPVDAPADAVGAGAVDLHDLVASAAPANLSLPETQGTATVGHALTALDGLWVGLDGTGVSTGYQWERCAGPTDCTAINGATGVAYTITPVDAGDRLRVSVTEHNAAGHTTVSSDQTPAVLGGTPYDNAVLMDQPSLYWPLDDTLGASKTPDIAGAMDGAQDAAIHGSVDTNADSVLPNGEGGSAQFSASLGYLDLHPYALPSTEHVSYEFWIQPDQITDAALVVHHASTWCSGGTWISLMSDGRVQASFADAPCHIVTATTTQTVPTDAPTHVVVTWDGTLARVYFNGEKVGEQSGSLPAGLNNEADSGLWVGNLAWYPYVQYHGRMDNLAIYGHVLPPAAIRAHYSAGDGDMTPVAHSSPVISGDNRVGQTLSATTSQWARAESDWNATFTYQWLRCATADTDSCVPINSAIASTYTLTGDDLGQRMVVQVRAENDYGNATAQSVETNEIDADTGSSASYHDAVMADSPDLYWDFENTPFTTIRDATGHHSDGTLTGSYSQTLGLFNGSDHAVRFTDTSWADLHPYALPSTSHLSIEFWIKPDQLTDSLLLNHHAYGWCSGGFWLALHSDGSLQAAVANSGCGIANAYTAAQSISTTQATHVVVTYDDTTVRIYLDGTQEAEQQATGIGDLFNYAPAGLWAANASWYPYMQYKGSMDDLAVYGQTLGQPAIQAHYAAAQ